MSKKDDNQSNPEINCYFRPKINGFIKSFYYYFMDIIDGSKCIVPRRRLAVMPPMKGEEKPIFYHSGSVPEEYEEALRKEAGEEIQDISVIVLVITAEETYLLGQVAYQLSHELFHHCIYNVNSDEHNKISWLEETICEAFSRYALKCIIARKNFSKLNIKRKDLVQKLLKYHNDVLKQSGTGALSSVHCYKELEVINETAEDRREDRFYEMKNLYKTMTDESILGLLHYRDYKVEEKLLIDSKRYSNDYQNEAIKYLCDLQDGMILDPSDVGELSPTSPFGMVVTKGKGDEYEL